MTTTTLSIHGTFFIIGTPIGNMGDITQRAIETLEKCKLLMCEDTRETKKLLNLLEISLGDKKLISVREQNEQSSCEELIKLLLAGNDVGYCSDAGMPAISDPGSRLVDAVLDADLRVNVVPGPSAVTSAVALSGFNSTAFIFKGFFPRKVNEQLLEIDMLNSSKEIVVYFESPNRLVGTLTVLSEKLSHTQRVVFARELTKKFEEIYRGTTNDVLHHFENGVKGECVIVIEPSNSVVKDPAITNIEEALKLLISNRVSSKNSIEIVQLLNGISKNDIKEIYNTLKG